MKSNVCRIEKGTRDLAAILNESERVAQYNGLSHKQNLQLRLLCEEIDGMLPNIIDDFDGELWIEFEDGVCKVNVSIQIPEIDAEKKEELISVAKNKKNAAAVGIVGKIRDYIETFIMDDDVQIGLALSSGNFGASTACFYNGDCDYIWRLDDYRRFVEKEEKAEAWDELEKSVIASVADDVIVDRKIVV